jgi:hypothetical protein
MNLRPQDVLVLLKIAAAAKGAPLRQLDVAFGLKLSPAEVSNSLQRATYAELFVPGERQDKRLGHLGVVRVNGLCEFAVYGIRYAFPAKLGELVVGLPTAWGAPPLSEKIVVSGDGLPVWADADGAVRGMAVRPLYSTVPQAARLDPKLYALLALIDVLRVGRARERSLAADALRASLVEP